MPHFPEPSAGFGHNPADKEASWGDFTVTVALVSTTGLIWTALDPKGLLTTTKYVKEIIGDAIDQYIILDAARFITNSVVIGNSLPADFGGSNADNPPGDGFFQINWNFAALTAVTSEDFTNTNNDTSNITVSIPYADTI